MVSSQTMPVDGQEAHNASDTPMANFVSVTHSLLQSL